MSIMYVVRRESHDGYSPDGPVSVWDHCGDAEAAAGEAWAMDPENTYYVEEIDGVDRIEIFHLMHPQFS